MTESHDRKSYIRKDAFFPTTPWTAIQDVNCREILKSELYGQYWAPLYTYLRRKGFTRQDAEDFVQGFLSEVLLGHDFLTKVDQTRGRFRSLLLKSLNNFIGMILREKRVATNPLQDVSEQDIPEAVPHDPGAAFDYAWAAKILDQVCSNTEWECKQDGLDVHWYVFRDKILLPLLDGYRVPCLSDICTKYNIASEARVSNMILTVKRRFKHGLNRYLEGEMTFHDFLNIFTRS